MDTFIEQRPCISCGQMVYDIFKIEGICLDCMKNFKTSIRHVGIFAALNNDICRYLQFYIEKEHKDYKNFISDRNLEHRFAQFIIDTFNGNLSYPSIKVSIINFANLCSKFLSLIKFL